MATINGSTSFELWLFKLEVTETGTSTENNTSTVRVDAYLGRKTSGSYLYGAQISIPVTVTGATKQTITYKNANRVDVAAGGWLKLGSATFTVPHNADGSKTITVSASFTNNVSPSSGSASGSMTLTTIARASQPSCITYPNHTQNVGEFGATISIHMNRKSDAFTHKVRYAFGNLTETCIDADTGKEATAVTTGFRWTIPSKLMDRIPNNVSASGNIYVDTYQGTKLIGTKACGFTATVPSSVKPTVTATLEDITAVGDLYGRPVQGLSMIKVTPSVTLGRSSPIKAYSITIDGATYTSNGVTTGVLANAGASVVTVTVTDSRGRKGTWTYTMQVYAYSRPQVSSLAVHRVDETGEEHDQGQYIAVTFSTDVSNPNSKNQVSYALRYKKATESNWSTVDVSFLNNNFNVRNYQAIFAASVSSSYDVELTATDRHHSASRHTSASTAFSLLDLHKSGTGARFGGVAELANAIQNDLSLKQTGNRYALSTPGVASQAGFVLLARIKVTAANADTPITFVLSRRQVESTMTCHVQLRNSDAETSTVQSFRYEGSNYGAFLTPFDTEQLTWDLYVQKGSAWDTVTIQDWYTSYPMESRVEVSFPGGIVDTIPTPYWRAGPLVAESILDCFFPVGFVLTLWSKEADPNTMYPGTTWVRISNAFLWGIDENGEIGVTGGEKTHKLTVNELPSHSHGSVYSQHATGTKDKAWYNTSGSSVAYGAVATGGDAAHNNMPPYVQVAIWRRTA